MDISNLYGTNVDLPHLGEVKVQFLTINSIIWTKENSSKDPYQFLRDYLLKFGEDKEGLALVCAHLSNEELNEISILLGEELLKVHNETENKKPIKSTKALKTFIEKISTDTEERSTQIIKDLFKSTQMTGLNSVLTNVRIPTSDIMKILDPVGIRTINKTLNSSWTTTLGKSLTVGQTLRDNLKSIPNLAGLDIGFALSNSLVIPQSDFSRLSEQISSQFRISSSLQNSIARANNLTRFSETYLTKALKLPGFNTTARAGLAGLSKKSTTGEILSNYTRTDLENSTPLSIAVKAISALDELEPEDIDEITQLSVKANDSMRKIDGYHIMIVLSFVQTIISVLTLYLAISNDSHEEKAEILSEVRALHEALVDTYEAKPNDFIHDRIVTGNYHLREGGHVKSPSITILNPGRIVREKNTKNAWVYVEVLPYGDEPIMYGWIYRGGIAKLP